MTVHLELCPECVGGGYVLPEPGTDEWNAAELADQADICPRCDGLGIRQ